MPYTFEQFRQEARKDFFETISPQEVEEMMNKASPKERLKGLAPEEVRKFIPPQDLLKGLSPQEIESLFTKL